MNSHSCKIELEVGKECHVIVAMSDDGYESDGPPTFTFPKPAAEVDDDNGSVCSLDGDDAAGGSIADSDSGSDGGSDTNADGSDSDAGPAMSGGASGAEDDDDALAGDDDDDTDDDAAALEKFDEETKQEYLLSRHPEAQVPSFEEVRALSKIVRDAEGRPADPLHRTQPMLTKYEKARVLGVRATQLASGAAPYVQLTKPAISELIVAEMELAENKLPFIIRRPLPNGGSEYWKLQDLARI